MSVVGKSVPRKDGLPKVSGLARYVDDITMPGMLHGRTIRATIPAGNDENSSDRLVASGNEYSGVVLAFPDHHDFLPVIAADLLLETRR